MSDDTHTVTFRLLDGTTEDRQLTTGELLDLNAKWMSPDHSEDDEPEPAPKQTHAGGLEAPSPTP